MDEKIFRKESLNQMKSPDKLGDYIKVCSNSMWFSLIGVCIILVGAVVWGFMGNIKKVKYLGADIIDGKATIYIKTEDIEDFYGKPLYIAGREYIIDKKLISEEKVQVGNEVTDMILSLSDINKLDFAYKYELNVAMDDGIYEAYVILEQNKPISLIVN